MKTRVHYAGKATGEVARLLNRLAAQGDYIYGIEDLGDQWVIFTTRETLKVETRSDSDLVTRSWVSHTEQPDTSGGAARVIDEDQVAAAFSRPDEPA